MVNWEQFEIDCLEFLQEQFGQYAQFIHQGGSDSTVPDIKVVTKNNREFYIEVKHSPAQCGQFVLFPKTKERIFEYSTQNTPKLNEYSQTIIDHMNNHFDEFCNAGTSGVDIIFSDCENIFTKWVVKIYKDKGVKFFITNNQTIFPIEKFIDFFTISAKYRVKRSGSSPVGYKYSDDVTEYVMSNYQNVNIMQEGEKVFVVSDQNIDNQKFTKNNVEYMFAKRGDYYEVRKLSNTYNANVIFSVKLKPNVSGLTIEDFIFVLVQ